MEQVKRLRFTGIWTLLGLLLVGTVVYVSLAPFSPSRCLAFPESDKAVHFAAYAAMMFWFAQVFPLKPISFLIASGLILLGILLEILQGRSGYRTFEYADMAANALGVRLGLLMSRTKIGGLFYVCEEVLVGPSDPTRKGRGEESKGAKSRTKNRK